jgi:hypothetical protein
MRLPATVLSDFYNGITTDIRSAQLGPIALLFKQTIDGQGSHSLTLQKAERVSLLYLHSDNRLQYLQCVHVKVDESQIHPTRVKLNCSSSVCRSVFQVTPQDGSA